MIDGNIIKGIFDIGVNFFDRYEKWQTLKNKTAVKTRLLYQDSKGGMIK